MKQVLSALVLAIILFSCKNSNSGSPKDTVSSFIKAAREGNLDEVKKYICKSDVSMLELGENLLAKFDPEASRNMKDKMMKQFRDKTKDAKVDIKDEKIDGDNATVNVEFINNGKTETHPFSLLREEGQWKLSLLSEAMKNAGSDAEIGKAMKNINVDSLKGSISEGMKEFDKMDKDSVKKAIEEGMKELEKAKDARKE